MAAAAAALSAEALLEPLVPPRPRAAAAAGQEEEEEEEEDTAVRVVLPDYQGWWAPLTHLFYSSTSRCLASAHPSSTREEIESYYCPSCLGYLAEAEAAAAGHRCPRCFDCPRCPPGGAAALVVVPAAGAGGGKGGWELRCGFCGWASGGELGLVEEDPEFLGMTLSVAERESGEEKRFQHLLGALRRRAVEQARERELGRLGLTLAFGVGGGGGKGPGLGLEGQGGGRWRLADLAKREAEAQAAAQEGYDPKRGAALYREQQGQLTAEGEPLPADFLGLPSLEGVTRGEQRLGMGLHQPRSTRDLRPLRKPLLTKRSRRCLRDVQAGRPGILLKPKLNPLEGDSSLRAHVGKWWQKDTSALHVLPAAAVVARRGWAFCLRLSNPLPGPVRVAVVSEAEAEGKAKAKEEPYYLRRLARALTGGQEEEAEAVAILRVDAGAAAAAEQEVAVQLDGREDEYLEDEEEEELGGEADPQEMDARARQLFFDSLGEDGGGGGSGPAVLLQGRHRAWLRVAVSPEEAAAAAAAAGGVVGVLLFLRLAGERGEFAAPASGSVASFLGHGQQGEGKGKEAEVVAEAEGGDGDASSIVVPLCLTFRHKAAAEASVAAEADSAAAAAAAAEAGGAPRTRAGRKKKEAVPATAVAPAATDTKSFFEGLLGVGGAPSTASAPAPAPAAAKPPEAPASTSAFFEGLLSSSSSAPASAAPAAPARRTRARAKEEGEKGGGQEDEGEGGGGGGGGGGLVSTLLSPLRSLGLGGSESGSGESSK